MAQEENVIQFKKPEGKKFNVKLKNYDGVVEFNFDLNDPLSFPYVFLHNRLFVTSRDEPNVLLERSYHVMQVMNV